MPAASAPFYADWTFWSFVAATIAIVLSQLPPIRMLLRKPRLEVEVHNRIALHHDIGYPLVDLYLGISNKGAATVRIRSAAMIVRRSGQELTTLFARSYFEKMQDEQTLLFVPQSVAPDEHWGHVVRFVPEVPRLEERELVALKGNLQANVVAKIEARKQQGLPQELQFADAPLVRPLMELFERQFKWLPGDYQVEVHIQSDDGVAAASRYRFTLFESESTELRGLAGEYAHGAGVFFKTQKPGVFPSLAQD